MAGTTNLIPGAQNFLATPKGAAFLKTVGQTALNIDKLSLAQKNYFFSQLRDYLNKPGNTPAGAAPTQAQATVQFSGKVIKPASNGNAYGHAVVYASASQMKFNLPPHQWSLPIDTTSLTGSNSKSQTNHSLRRARMYFFGSTTTNANSKLQISNTSSANNLPADSNYVITEADNYWGFQFLWNPTTIQSAVSRKADFTPSSTDVLAGLQGLFTAMETIQFTIVINRVNDFAWGASVKGGAYIGSTFDPNGALYNALNGGENPYTKGGNPGVSSQDQTKQILDLLNKGTMADVEYLFRTINGKGNNGKTWTNALGRETADIGFLSPNPIALELGPTGDNLSYVGWVEGLAINHSKFTENMIPLHTEIQVTFYAFSRTSLKSSE